MARYRRVSTKMWADERVRSLSASKPCGQVLWFHLLTGEQTGIIPGLCRIGEAAFAEQLGWSVEGFREAFREVFRQGMAEADWKARVVWVPKAIHHNRPESPNVVRAWADAWDEIPECGLKREAWRALKAFVEALGEGFAKAFAEACPEPSAKASPNQEQDQEQDQEQEQEQEQEQDLSAAPAEKPAALAAEEQAPDAGLHREVIDRFCAGFLVKRGFPYQVVGKRDGAQVKALLKRPGATLREIQRRMDNAFADPWFLRAGDLAVFCSKWNQYGGAGPPAAPKATSVPAAASAFGKGGEIGL